MRSTLHLSSVFVLFIGAALYPAARPAMAQSKDPIVGTWLLDRGKSEFMPDSGTLQTRTMIFEAVENGVNCIIRTESTRRDTSETRYTAHYDGKDAPIDVSALDTVALRRIDASTVERTGKVKGKAVETAVMKISADGKVLTVTTKGSANGEPYSSTQVFDKQ